MTNSPATVGAPDLDKPTNSPEKSWPARIWLQTGDADALPDFQALRHAGDGITWADDQIDRFDVEYVRADLAKLPAAAPADLIDAHRYRFLRNNNITTNVRFHFASGESPYLYAEELDKAIDHNMGYVPAATAPVAPSDERQAFEAWADEHLGQGYPLQKDEGTYENKVTRWAFKAWQARAQLAAHPSPAPTEAVHQYRKQRCSDWYDGYPDESDGGGPYESRTLYAAPAAPVDRVMPAEAQHEAIEAAVDQHYPKQDSPHASVKDRIGAARIAFRRGYRSGFAAKGTTPAAPAGYQIVPIEPTEDMVVAFAETWFSKVRAIDDHDMTDAYAAMLAAAPTPGQQDSAQPGGDA